MLTGVLVAVVHNLFDFLVGDDGRGVVHFRDAVAILRVRVINDKPRVFHNVAVGVIERAMIRGVGHGECLLPV